MDGRIYIAYCGDIKKTAIELLEAADAKSSARPGMRISLKPNLVVGRPADEGATTHPEIAAGIIEYFIENGFRDIEIIEGSWVGDDTKRAFSRCGYDAVGKKYGVPLYDLKKDAAVEVDTPIGPMKICERVLKSDFLVDIPVMKGHCQTVMTCALKNLKGCIPDGEKRRFHSLGLHRPIAALASALKPSLVLVDSVCGDLDFEEGGNPVRQDRLILSKDPVKTDVFACRLMGIDPDEVDYIALAAKYGAGDMSLSPEEIVEVSAPVLAKSAPERSYKVKSLTKKVREDRACSACYGALVHALARLDEGGGLRNAPEIFIGQGYKGKSGMDGLGVGICAKGAARCAMGCPPDARSILEALSGRV